jgi:hypothetical protein
VDLRLSDEQLALREEARVFAAALRPTLEADPEWRRQGMLPTATRGRSRRRSARRAGSA